MAGTTSSRSYDVIVLGLGATGGAALYHLAKQGVRVLGLDRYAPPHPFGSSHGHTRIYRQAYYEAPEYVPLTVRALDMWHELERETGRTLFANTGSLTVAPEDNPLFAGALQSAREHGIAHDLMSLEETLRRFPAFNAPKNCIGLFEPTAGVLFADLCVQSHLELAQKAGAEMRLDEPAWSVEQRRDGTVVVQTAKETYEAGRVVVAAGAWTPRLLNLEHAFHVTRETVHWFNVVAPAATAANGCPVSLIAMEDGAMFYSIPDFGDGFKAGLHHSGRTGDAH
ncbi:MAG: N-methyl-L-tryptophan oxidase, partial [Gemmatimonadaceae bacterium]